MNNPSQPQNNVNNAPPAQNNNNNNARIQAPVHPFDDYQAFTQNIMAQYTQNQLNSFNFRNQATNPNFTMNIDPGSLTFNNSDQNSSIPIPRMDHHVDTTLTTSFADHDLSWFQQPTLPRRGNAGSLQQSLVNQVPIMAAHVNRTIGRMNSTQSTPVSGQPAQSAQSMNEISALNTPTRQIPESHNFNNNYRLPADNNRPSDSFLNYPNNSMGQEAFAQYCADNPRRRNNRNRPAPTQTNTTVLANAPALSRITEESMHTPTNENQNNNNASENPETTQLENSNLLATTEVSQEPNFELLANNAQSNNVDPENQEQSTQVESTNVPPNPSAPAQNIVDSNRTDPIVALTEQVSRLVACMAPRTNNVDPSVSHLGNEITRLAATLQQSNHQPDRNQMQDVLQSSTHIQNIDKIRTRIYKTSPPPILESNASLIVYLRIKFDRYRKLNLHSKFEIQTALSFAFMKRSQYISDFVGNMVKVCLPDKYGDRELTNLYRQISQKFSNSPNELSITKLGKEENIVDFFQRVLVIIEENKTHSGAFNVPPESLNAYTLQRMISKSNPIMDFSDIRMLSTIVSQSPQIPEPGKLHYCFLDQLAIHEILSKFEFQRSYETETDINNVVSEPVNALYNTRSNTTQPTRQNNSNNRKPTHLKSNLRVPPKSEFVNCCDLCGREHQGKCKMLQIFLKGFACDFCIKAVTNENKFAYNVYSTEVRHDGMHCKLRTPDHPYPFPNKLKPRNSTNDNRQSSNNRQQYNNRQNHRQQYNQQPVNNLISLEQPDPNGNIQTHPIPSNSLNQPNPTQPPILDGCFMSLEIVEIDTKSTAFNTPTIDVFHTQQLARQEIDKQIIAYKSHENTFLYLTPTIDNSFSFTVVVDTGCKPQGCIGTKLVVKLHLQKFRTSELVRVRTADGNIVGPYNILSVPMTFGLQSIDVKLVELPDCPCGILLGLPALERLNTSTGENARVRFQQVLDDITKSGPKNQMR